MEHRVNAGLSRYFGLCSDWRDSPNAGRRQRRRGTAGSPRGPVPAGPSGRIECRRDALVDRSVRPPSPNGPRTLSHHFRGIGCGVKVPPARQGNSNCYSITKLIRRGLFDPFHVILIATHEGGRSGAVFPFLRSGCHPVRPCPTTRCARAPPAEMTRYRLPIFVGAFYLAHFSGGVAAT